MARLVDAVLISTILQSIKMSLVCGTMRLNPDTELSLLLVGLIMKSTVYDRSSYLLQASCSMTLSYTPLLNHSQQIPVEKGHSNTNVE